MQRLCLLNAVLLLIPISAAFASEPERPRLNVVFIVADDLGWGETGCYGQEKIPTPNIDRLAAQGMRFTRHYAGAPVCAPSRCVLLTGRHLGHAEVRGNQQASRSFPQFNEGQHPLSESARTFLQLFQEARYATAAMGKWGLGPVGSTGEPNRKGLDLFFGYNCQAVAHSCFPGSLWRNREQIPLNAKPVSGHHAPVTGEVILDDWVGEQYAPLRMTDEAVEFIKANHSRPFFLYLPFIEPHVAMHPPREWVEKFPREWDDEPYRGQCGYLPHPRPRAGYAAMIALLDHHVGRVLEALDQAGVAERTLVVFTSDNGTTHTHAGDRRFHVGGVDARFFNSTRGLRGYKGSLYEGGIRVPMIARLPGKIAAGSTNDTPGYFADWFPTLCDAAGLELPAGLDGQTLWPEMTGTAAPARKNAMVWVFPEYGGQAAVRLGQFKVIRQGLKTKMPGPWEVYDIDADPGEQHNLANDRRDLVREAEMILRREMDDNAVCPLAIPGVNAPADR